MRYLNNDDLKKYSSSMLYREKAMILESADFSKKSAYAECQVFLSHSSKDIEALPEVIKFLESFGVKVYIDKNDKSLPSSTSPKTAGILKQRIKDSKKIIVLVSENSKESKWIPWELGLGDVMKTVDNIALLPLTNNSSKPSWPEQEYLGLYPRVALTRFKNQYIDQWIVVNHHEDTGIEISEWLRK